MITHEVTSPLTLHPPHSSIIKPVTDINILNGVRKIEGFYIYVTSEEGRMLSTNRNVPSTQQATISWLPIQIIREKVGWCNIRYVYNG